MPPELIDQPAATLATAATAPGDGDVLDAAETAAFAEIGQEVAPVVAEAGQLVVEGTDEAQAAGELLKKLKAGKNAIEKVRKDTKAPHLARTRAIDERARELTRPLDDVYEQVKDGLQAFLRQQAEQRRLAEEAARIEQETQAAAAQVEADAAAAAVAQADEQRQHDVAQEGGRRAEIAAMGDADLVKLALTPPTSDDVRRDREMATAEMRDRRARGQQHEQARAVGAVAARAAATPAAVETPAPVNLSSAAGTIARRTRTAITITDERFVPRMYCSVDMAKLREAVKQGITDIAGVRVEEVDDLAVTAR